MARPKKILTAVGTFATALAIGSIMQYGDALAARFSPEDQQPVPLTDAQAEAIAALTPAEGDIMGLPDDVAVTGLIGVSDVALPPAPVEEPVQLAAVTDAEVDAPVFDVPQTIVAATCDVAMDLQARSMAMVQIDVAAPCFGNTSLVIHHQGMMFTAVTDDLGKVSLTVPALAEDAFFIAAFDNREGAVAQILVPDVANYDRAVLQWQGRSDVQLHAREFGANYGEPGHIWAASVGDVATMANGGGGYLTRLGDSSVNNPLMAEVYTYPSATTSRDGNVDLTVEVEITQRNCGRDVAAQSMQIVPGSDTFATDLTMTMPDCDAVGEFLVLNNMFEDLTLASR